MAQRKASLKGAGGEGVDAVSPWRAAKPRRPLKDFPSSPKPEQESKSGEEESFSPPNSGFKESTRVGSGLKTQEVREGINCSQGASPEFSRSLSVSNKSQGSARRGKGKEQVSFTKLKSGDKEENEDVFEEDSEEDQPAARCHYVGTSRGGSLSRSRGSPNISSTSILAVSRTEEKAQVTAQKGGCGLLWGALIAGLAFVLYMVQQQPAAFPQQVIFPPSTFSILLMYFCRTRYRASIGETCVH